MQAKRMEFFEVNLILYSDTVSRCLYKVGCGFRKETFLLIFFYTAIYNMVITRKIILS